MLSFLCLLLVRIMWQLRSSFMCHLYGVAHKLGRKSLPFQQNRSCLLCARNGTCDAILHNLGSTVERPHLREGRTAHNNPIARNKGENATHMPYTYNQHAPGPILPQVFQRALELNSQQLCLCLGSQGSLRQSLQAGKQKTSSNSLSSDILPEKVPHGHPVRGLLLPAYSL